MASLRKFTNAGTQYHSKRKGHDSNVRYDLIVLSKYQPGYRYGISRKQPPNITQSSYPLGAADFGTTRGAILPLGLPRCVGEGSDGTGKAADEESEEGTCVSFRRGPQRTGDRDPLRLKLLWQEWRETHPDGMSYVTWCRRSRHCRPRRDVTMCQNRHQRFESVDLPHMKPLPARRWQRTLWCKNTVHPDYHIAIERHFYSVPHEYVGKEADVRLRG